MSATCLTYGNAKDVRDWLMNTNLNEISISDLVGALANAMQRIEHLEAQAQDHRDRIWKLNGAVGIPDRK